MTVDHSLTYTKFSPAGLFHRARLTKILDMVRKTGGQSLADVGCSNGYITALLKQETGIRKVAGFDWKKENIAEARKRSRDIEWYTLDLNEAQDPETQYDVVCCFETLEHVGNLDEALATLLKLTSAEGTLIITVPIETGFWGILKFARRLAKREKVDLPGFKYAEYFRDLLRGEISAHRLRDRGDQKGYGTHFGFDWRSVTEFFDMHDIPYDSFSHFSTRFIRVCG